MYICIRVCIVMCIYITIHTCMYYAYVCAHVHVHIHVHRHTSLCDHRRHMLRLWDPAIICVHVGIHLSLSLSIYIYIYIYISAEHLRIRDHLRPSLLARALPALARLADAGLGRKVVSLSLYTYIYIYTYICICIYIYILCIHHMYTCVMLYNVLYTNIMYHTM